GDDRSSDKMISFSTGFMKRYVGEEEREAQKNQIAQKYIKRKANKIEAEMRAAGFDMTIEEYEAEMKRLKKECDEDLKTFRNMPLSRFGLANCDAISRMREPARVLAKYVDASGKDLKI